ncbi:MAG: SIR2 family protein [Gammaproteobacteria bacterium]|nr:MAG: SIR2 family protein [Gammaproteobacteria bacterium]
MPHILLTGAGFTRNWGGWLAKELEGDLLARLAQHDPLRRLIQSSDNYEEALGKARSGGDGRVRVSPEEVRILEDGIKESFWAMNIALGQRVSMYLAGETEHSILSFLPKFDAIFTLNQDLLLELHYNAAHRPGRWAGSYYPGIEPAVATPLNSREVIRLERRVGTVGQPDPSRQPIYKLHGSIEWTDGTDSLFVVGGGKEAYIQEKPLLTQYFKILKDYLHQPNTRLMIIGYGFADNHVNQLIESSSQANPSLSVYYVHPHGRDAIRRGVQNRAVIQPIPPLADVPCIGESRRPLTTTFGGDTLEYDKVMRFFEWPLKH